MVEPRIFISMGTPYNDEYRLFRDQLEAFLRDRCHVDPRIIGKNEYPDGSPLDKIRSVMSRCHGVIVVAYERKFLELGVEKRTSSEAKELSQRTYTTPWNHIESAMAYTLGLPLYIICQRDLTEEGLIEDKLDWYVQKIDLQPGILEKPEIGQSLQGWIETRVKPRSRKPRLVRTIEGSVRFSDMTPKEIGGAFAALAGAFGAGAFVSQTLPQMFG